MNGLRCKWAGLWIAHWDRLWFRLWSVRLNILGALLMGTDFVLSLTLDSRSPPWMAGLGAIINVAAWWARGLPQQKARETAAAESEAKKAAAP